MHSLRPALEERRKHYGATMTVNECVEMLNYVIFHDTIGGFALGEKTSGSYGTRSDGKKCSVDGLIWKLDRTFVDGIGDAGGKSVPTWQVRQVGQTNPETGQPYKPFPGNLVPAIDPGTGPAPPNPPPSGDLEARVTALEAANKALTARVAGIERELSDLTAKTSRMDIRLKKLEDAPPGGITAEQAVAAVIASVRTDERTIAYRHDHDLKRK